MVSSSLEPPTSSLLRPTRIPTLLWQLPFLHSCPCAQPRTWPHKSQEKVQLILDRWIPLFTSIPFLLPTLFWNSFSQTVWIPAAIKSISIFPSSIFQSFWQEEQPCWSGCLCVSGPELTKQIGGSSHDSRNERNSGLQQVRLGFEEHWDSHTACHCFSTTNSFWQLLGLFFPKHKELSCFGKNLITKTWRACCENKKHLCCLGAVGMLLRPIQTLVPGERAQGGELRYLTYTWDASCANYESPMLTTNNLDKFNM